MSVSAHIPRKRVDARDILDRIAAMADRPDDGFRPQSDGGGEAEAEGQKIREQKIESFPDLPNNLPNPTQKQLARLYRDSDYYIQTLFNIRNKRGTIVPFTYNFTQRHIQSLKRAAFSQGRPLRFLIAKYRRGGITTYEQAKTLSLVATRKGHHAVTLADTKDKAIEIFQMVELMFQSIPDPLRPYRANVNRKELYFPNLLSRFGIGTAGSTAFGRGGTLQRVHGSEVAFWLKSRPPEEAESLLAGLTEACSHGEVVLESTANGASGWWYDTVMEAKAGKNEWTLLFVPWFIDPTLRSHCPPYVQQEIIDTLDEREKWLVEEHGLTIEQLYWRRNKKSEKAMRRLWPQEYPELVEESFLSFELCYFEWALLNELTARCQAPEQSWQNARKVIVRPPAEGRQYTIGCDPAEGTPEGDYSFAGVLDNATGEQVAWIHCKVRPEEFARMVAKLGAQYNNAMIICERNNHGHAVLLALQNIHRYSPLFYAREFDRASGRKSRRVLGWDTNQVSRPILLDDLRDAMIDGDIKVNDVEFLTECRTFELSTRNRYEARAGYHDDRILGWAIAWQGLKEGPPNIGVHIL